MTTFAVRAFNKEMSMPPASAPARVSAAGPLPARAAAAQPPASAVKAAVVTVRPNGFEPSEITEPKGLFVLAVENRSGLQTIQLRLDAVTGNRINDRPIPRNKHDLAQALDLPPGQYVLSEAYHPDWRCTITITAK